VACREIKPNEAARDAGSTWRLDPREVPGLSFNAVGANEIAPDAVVQSEIAANAVISSKIADATIQRADISGTEVAVYTPHADCASSALTLTTTCSSELCQTGPPYCSATTLGPASPSPP
jgi:hypothetical protein